MYYYKQVEGNKIISVEAKSKDSVSPGFVKITKAIYDSYLVSLPVVEPETPRDLATEVTAQKAEIDELKARLDKAGVA